MCGTIWMGSIGVLKVWDRSDSKCLGGSMGDTDMETAFIYFPT